MLKRLKQQGITILVSTPYMDEASLCDRVALIQNGKLLSVNTPAGVIHEFKKPLVAVKSSNMMKLLNEIKQSGIVEDAYPFGEYHHVVMKEAGDKESLKNYLESKNDKVEFLSITPDIEDCFMALMKN